MASIDSQIAELSKLAEENGLEIAGIFKESRSAKAPGREIFSDMMQRIEKGEADGIICWKLNRLARNPIDGGKISWMLQQGIIQHIFTHGRSYYPSDNVIVMAVELGMANQFIRDLSIDTRRGLVSKAERGWYPAFCTVGYIDNPGKRKGEKEIVPDPERFPLVRRMFDLMLTGTYTPPMILEIATQEWGLRMKNGKPMARSTAYRILTDPFYYGEFEYPKGSGNWYQGKHEPMITRDEYDKIQRLLGRKGSPRIRKHMFTFTSMIRCGECGCLITAETKTKHQKNGNVHSYTYYRCTKRRIPCSQKTVRDGALEEQILEELDRITIPPEFKEWAMEILDARSQKDSSGKKIIVANQKKNSENCLKELDGLIGMRARGEIDQKTFLRKKMDLEKEKTELDKILQKNDETSGHWLKRAGELFGFAELAKYRFETGDRQERREILATLGSNLLLKDRKLDIQGKNELLFMEELSQEERMIRERLEPLDLPSDKAKLRAEYARSPVMLRR